jgi:hypothetical protein
MHVLQLLNLFLRALQIEIAETSLPEPMGEFATNSRNLDSTRYTWYTYYAWIINMTKQNLTVSLPQHTIRKAKILAARRGSSISGLLAEQIEILVGEEEAYERAERQARMLLDQGFHLGGVIRASRDEWHER